MAINAKTIMAKTVAEIQYRGPAKEARQMIELAELINHGDITAEQIISDNVVTLQFISDLNAPRISDFKSEFHTLHQNVEKAVCDNEITNKNHVKEIQESLQAVQKELDQSKPSGDLIIPKLKRASEILTEAAKLAENTGTLGSALIRQAPVAATVWQAALKIFGG